MKNWIALAQASAPDIPKDQVERIAPSLDRLEASFRPLIARLGQEDEIAIRYEAEGE